MWRKKQRSLNWLEDSNGLPSSYVTHTHTHKKTIKDWTIIFFFYTIDHLPARNLTHTDRNFCVVSYLTRPTPQITFGLYRIIFQHLWQGLVFGHIVFWNIWQIAISRSHPKVYQTHPTPMHQCKNFFEW